MIAHLVFISQAVAVENIGALFVAVPAMSQEKSSIPFENLVRFSLARNRGKERVEERPHDK